MAEDDARYGAPQGAFRALAARRPPGLLFTGRAFRSPLRGPWLTSVFAAVLLALLPVVTITGLLSYIAYQPQFEGNGLPADTHGLHLPFFTWPTNPAWLYRLNQGLHVALGLALVPVVLAKLWSVIPKLFAWPPSRSIAQLLERASVLLLVGSILFELVTGVLNIQYDYVYGFDFYTAHYYGAWVFIAAFLLHVGLKFPTMVKSLRSRSLREELRTPLADTVPEPPDDYGLVSPDPAPATVSRRGALAIVGGAGLAVTAVTIGQTVTPLRPFAVLSARGQSYGSGPNDFQVNRTAMAAGIVPAVTGVAWALTVTGREKKILTLRQLQSLPQHTARLPIACVEGWSTVQSWSGVRLRDLVALTGTTELSHGVVTSLEKEGAFARAALNRGQLLNPDSLLALRVNGADLSPDHGYPARVIVPALPGVHNTKWVNTIELVLSMSDPRIHNTVTGRWRRAYGASPLHLVSLLACFALAGWAALSASSGPSPLRMALWFLGAAILHDFVLFPLYTRADRYLRALGAVNVNYVRVPALISVLLLVMFYPLILRRSQDTYGNASGLDQSGYLGSWLLVTAIVFGVSALLFGLRRARGARSPAPRADPAHRVQPDSLAEDR
ncbi:MAG: molybdopterin-dependent oxidoreductase [Sporichthya sp.]|nr:molybdopterin-dependent oxidoreductase [Sporichthya sp.]MBA3743218.1 molybdopterin-dependent oxidoreductase [Sporichthya sp.]